MDVVPVASRIHEHLGPVVPVDTDGESSHHRLRASVNPSVNLQVPRVPSTGSAGLICPSDLGGSEHKLIGSTDEHHILTTAGGQRAAALRAAMRPKPRFHGIVNDYVGACFEDNCNIGKIIPALCNSHNNNDEFWVFARRQFYFFTCGFFHVQPVSEASY